MTLPSDKCSCLHTNYNGLEYQNHRCCLEWHRKGESLNHSRKDRNCVNSIQIQLNEKRNRVDNQQHQYTRLDKYWGEQILVKSQNTRGPLGHTNFQPLPILHLNSKYDSVRCKMPWRRVNGYYSNQIAHGLDRFRHT